MAYPSVPGWKVLFALCWVLVLMSARPASGDDEIGSVAALDSARERLRDAQTARALSAEGQLLYQRDRVKLTGFEYCGQSIALSERGDFRASIQAASKALYLGQQESKDDLQAAAKRDLAIAFSYAGDLERAEGYARDALSHRASESPLIAAPAFKVIGDVHGRRADWPKAIEFYQHALELASEKYRPLVQVSLANAFVAAGDVIRARDLYDRIDTGRIGPLAQAFGRGMGNLLLAEGKPSEALNVFRSAAETASGSDAAYHRVWALDGAGRSHAALGNRTAAKHAFVEAARLGETVRARFRSEEFKSGLFGDIQSIFEQAIALAAEEGDAQSAWDLSEASRSRALLDVVRGRVNVHRDGTRSASASEAIPLGRVQSALGPREAVIQYHGLPDRLLAWVIRPDAVSITSIALDKNTLNRLVDEFRQAILERRGDAVARGGALYQHLVAPLSLRDRDQLIIVPHGALHYLPFQALAGAGRFLIEGHPVAIAPSASVAVQLVLRSRAANGKLVAFGNPDVGDPKLALPGAEREVKRISGHFDEQEVFLRQRASKRQFQESATTARVLHVAAHAQVDELDPLMSKILLSNDPGESGFLEAREVYRIDLKNVSLVTLSACESGLGRIARGDEILGFTRSFLSAGASTLLVSLWPVSDRSTEILMSSFYRELGKGERAIDAMRTAQLEVLRRPRMSHPFFWAPFNLIGDWRVSAGR